MINLTLNKLKRPALQNLVPKFGTKVEKNDINKGGLSTAEVDLNMTLPFELMRETEVYSSDTTTKIQYDAKIAIVGSDYVTLTLDQGTYKGCTITIKNRNTEQATIIVSEDNQKNLEPNKSLVLEWDGTTWIDTTLIIDSTVSEDSHNPISSAAVYQKANEITLTVINETNARNEAIAEERRLREEANTAVEQKVIDETTARTEADTELGTRIDGEVEARMNADSELDGKITSTNNSIGQLESLKTTDKSSTVAAINEVYNKVQQSGSAGNTATNCEQFTFVVDSNEALAAWANNDKSKGQDYTSVLIRKGEYISTVGVNLTTAGTKVVVGEAGSELVFRFVEKGLFYDTLPADSRYYMTNVSAGTYGNSESYVFYNCTNLTNCNGEGSATPSYNGCGFYNCTNLTNCMSYAEGLPSDGPGTGYGFYKCANLTNCSGEGQGTQSGFGFYDCTNLINCIGIGESDDIGCGFNLCRGVSYCKAGKKCTTSVFKDCYASQSNTDDYACADTPAGGFNNTTNPA